MEGFEVSVLRQYTHQPVVMFVLVTLSPNRGHFLCDCELSNILVLLGYSLVNCHEYVGIWVVKVFNSFLYYYFHQFSSLNYEQFLTKHVVFIIYARDYLTVWSSFAFCVVLHFSALSDIEN